MDSIAVQAALRIPEPRRASASLDAALRIFEAAVRREALAQVEASIARRPSTLRATLKATTALTRARAELLLELRAFGPPLHEPALRFCT